MSGLRLRERRRRDCGKVGIPRFGRDSQAWWESPKDFSTERLFHSLLRFVLPRLRQAGPSFRVVATHHVRPISNAPALIQMFADGDRASSECSSPARRFDLPSFPSHHYRVIPAHHPRLLHREQNIQILPLARQKRATRLQSRHLKSLIELGRVLLLEKSIGLLQRAHPAQTQLLRQAPLPGSKTPL